MTGMKAVDVKVREVITVPPDTKGGGRRSSFLPSMM
jgi:hypothetical protein